MHQLKLYKYFSGSASARHDNDFGHCSTPYLEPWESNAAGGFMRPGTPYTEIEEKVVGTRKNKCKVCNITHNDIY